MGGGGDLGQCETGLLFEGLDGKILFSFQTLSKTLPPPPHLDRPDLPAPPPGAARRQQRHPRVLREDFPVDTLHLDGRALSWMSECRAVVSVCPSDL